MPIDLTDHEAVQHDLAESRVGMREIVAERLSIGPMGSGGQADVFAMKPSWTNPNPAIYEVKVSRADFQQDVQGGKYRRYLPYCRRLYFAAPKGLLSKADMPVGMGLIVRGDNGWHVVKAPRIQADPEGLPEIVFALLLRVHPGGFSPLSRTERIRRMSEADDLRRARYELPPRVRRILEEGEDAKAALRGARARLAQALGLDPSVDERDIWQLATEVLERAPITNRQNGSNRLRRNLELIQSVARRAEAALDEMEAHAP